jgi:hypothetical protein
MRISDAAHETERGFNQGFHPSPCTLLIELMLKSMNAHSAHFLALKTGLGASQSSRSDFCAAKRVWQTPIRIQP